MSVIDIPFVTRTRRVGRHIHASAQRVRYAYGFPTALAILAILLAEMVFTGLQLVFNTGLEVTGGVVVLLAAILIVSNRWGAHLPGTAHSTYGDSGTSKVPHRRGLVIVAGLDSAGPPDDVTTTTPGAAAKRTPRRVSAAATLLHQATAAEFVAIIGTPQGAARGVHKDLVNRARACGIKKIQVWEKNNAESVADSEKATSAAIQWMLDDGKLDAADIVVDVSAGRRPMTYGAKDAADEVFVETQYLANEWDPATNEPVPGTQMFKVIKTYY